MLPPYQQKNSSIQDAFSVFSFYDASNLPADAGIREIWRSLLREFLQEFDDEDEHHPSSVKVDDGYLPGRGPLEKVAPGPWCSRGGYFDYSTWRDRERFLELDRALAAAHNCFESEEEPERFLPIAALGTLSGTEEKF